MIGTIIRKAAFYAATRGTVYWLEHGGMEFLHDGFDRVRNHVRERKTGPVPGAVTEPSNEVGKHEDAMDRIVQNAKEGRDARIATRLEAMRLEPRPIAVQADIAQSAEALLIAIQEAPAPVQPDTGPLWGKEIQIFATRPKGFTQT